MLSSNAGIWTGREHALRLPVAALERRAPTGPTSAARPRPTTRSDRPTRAPTSGCALTAADPDGDGHRDLEPDPADRAVPAGEHRGAEHRWHRAAHLHALRDAREPGRAPGTPTPTSGSATCGDGYESIPNATGTSYMLGRRRRGLHRPGRRDRVEPGRDDLRGEPADLDRPLRPPGQPDGARRSSGPRSAVTCSPGARARGPAAGTRTATSGSAPRTERTGPTSPERPAPATCSRSPTRALGSALLVTAQNPDGQTSAASLPTASVQAAAPVGTASPQIVRHRAARQRPDRYAGVVRGGWQHVRLSVAALRRRRQLDRHRRRDDLDLHARGRRRGRRRAADGHGGKPGRSGRARRARAARPSRPRRPPTRRSRPSRAARSAAAT